MHLLLQSPVQMNSAIHFKILVNYFYNNYNKIYIKIYFNTLKIVKVFLHFNLYVLLCIHVRVYCITRKFCLNKNSYTVERFFTFCLQIVN